jgi:hypothetical protein
MRLASFPRMARIDRFLAQKGRRRSRAIPHIGVRHRDDVPKRETSRIVPWREGALGNKRTFRRAFAARFLLPAARGRAALQLMFGAFRACPGRLARPQLPAACPRRPISLLPFGGSLGGGVLMSANRVDNIDANAVPLGDEQRRKVRCSSIRFEPLTVCVVPDLAAVAVGLPVVLRRGAGGLKALGVCCMCSVVQR